MNKNVNEVLNELVKEQEQLVDQYKQLAKVFEKDNSIQEAIKLKEKVEILEKELKTTKKELHTSRQEANELQVALNSHVMNEKLTIAKYEKGKLDYYFKNEMNKRENHLKQLRQEAYKKMGEIVYITDRDIWEDKNEVYGKIQVIRDEVEDRIREKRSRLQHQMQYTKQEAEHKIDEEVSQPVNKDALKKRVKHNVIETKIGLNWFNKIGALIMLIGMVAFLRYSYVTFFTPMMKGIFSMVIGGVFIAAGEYFRFKKKKVFSTGLTGAGFGILYISTFMSYFMLNIISMSVAFILCLLISTGAFVLSTTTHSKTIGILALVGGYIPLGVTYFMGVNQGILIIIYGILLVGVALAIGIKKNWSILIYLSYGMNFVTVVPLINELQSPYVATGVILVLFAMYLVGTLYYPFANKLKLGIGHIIVLGLNTFISSGLLYWVLEGTVLRNAKGIVAIIFCVLYIGLERWVNKYLPEEKTAKLLFYITAMTFSILIIPFQFGLQWTIVAWVVEGLLLSLYGMKEKMKRLEIGGNILLIASAVVYWYTNLNIGIYHEIMELFVRGSWEKGINIWSITAIVLASFILLFAYAKKKQQTVLSKQKQEGYIVFKYLVLVHFAVYLLLDVYPLLPIPYDLDLILMYIIAVAVLIGVLLQCVPLLRDETSQGVSLSLVGFMALIVCGLNYMNSSREGIWLIVYVSALVLINLGIIVVFVKALRAWKYKNLQVVHMSWMILLAYILINVTGLGQSYMGMAFNSGGISVVYVVAAFGAIIYGFKEQNPMLRYAGLVVSLLAIVKLFIFDIGSGSSPMIRIASYFGLGLGVLAISFIYQKFSKGLQGEDLKEKQETQEKEEKGEADGEL